MVCRRDSDLPAGSPVNPAPERLADETVGRIAVPKNPTCQYSRLGVVDYQEAWDLQRQLATLRDLNQIPDTLLLLEHPHTYTLGRTGKREHLLAGPEALEAIGATAIDTDRGGDITYHGPGQLVGYPIMLVNDRRDLLQYIRKLEESIIRALNDLGIQSGRISGLTGVWVGEKKIAAIGVKMGRVSTHGFALNVTTDLTYFGHIIPCGIRDKGVTSIEEQVAGPGRAGSSDSLDRRLMEQMVDLLVKHFGKVFERRMAMHIGTACSA